MKRKTTVLKKDKMRLTKRHKIIALYPDYRFSKEEIKEAKLLVKGHYWNRPSQDHYVAFSSSNRKKFFEYNFCLDASLKQKKECKKLARRCAKLWSQNQYFAANLLDDYNYKLHG